MLFLRFDARYYVYCARCGGLVLLLGKEGDFCRTAGGWGTFEIYSGSDGLPGPANGYPRAGRPWKAVPKRVEALPSRLFPHCYRVPQKFPGPPRALHVLARFFNGSKSDTAPNCLQRNCSKFVGKLLFPFSITEFIRKIAQSSLENCSSTQSSSENCSKFVRKLLKPSATHKVR